MVTIILTLAACKPGVEPIVPPDETPTVPTEPPVGDDDDCVPAGEVVINELSPANMDTLVDEDGDSVDWIEVTNADPAPIDLAGWSLTDDEDEPTKWQFPAMTLEPGAFLLV